MIKSIQTQLARLARTGALPLLRTGLKGLEKESLRISPSGLIAQTPHPAALGSALTHPHITTDYSEALIELVTPPFSSVTETLAFLDDLHRFTYQHLDEELLWAASMPCRIDGDDSIPIARYGSSNIGQMKHVYRRGLAYRYGRAMQTIAGVHFNYSVDEAFWPLYREIEDYSGALCDFIADRYFGAIRNVHRHGWILLYLFGSSPTLCKSFFSGRGTKSDHFAELDAKTAYRRYATSLRMSDIGYKNDSQSSVSPCLDNLENYVASLSRAIETPYPPYEAIGVKVDGEYRQLNANLLQIENEYYSPVRPKQITRSGEKPTLALKKRGVNYLELRSVDLNCFEPNGVSLQQLYFLENFLLFCLIAESPPLCADEKLETGQNALSTACCGRTPGFALSQRGTQRSLHEWASEILDGMSLVAEILDQGHRESRYAPVIEQQREKVADPDATPSARLLDQLEQSGLSFADYALQLSREHAEYFLERPLEGRKLERLEELAASSIEEQARIEADDDVSFDEFLRRYFAQS
ncbi:glutamate--cysteine ligase [Methylolobus aquaticus]